MKLSVIIPVYNEEDVIIDCLKSLSHQIYKDFEIIVVDDGSTDNLKLKSQNLKILTQNHKGPGAARNLGAKHAKGDILVFVDADMTFDSKFLQELIEPILYAKAKGTFSKNEYVSNWRNRWARCWNINEGWESGRRHPKGYTDKQKVFRAILKSEFDKVGGFDPSRGYTDDWTLSERLGYEAEIASGAKFFHKNPEKLTEVFKHAHWVGKRRYKLGFLGYILALFRSSLPVSLVVGILKGLLNHMPDFIIFKVIYDFGIFSGILDYILTGRAMK